jgi:hypothetical protein
VLLPENLTAYLQFLQQKKTRAFPRKESSAFRGDIKQTVFPLYKGGSTVSIPTKDL